MKQYLVTWQIDIEETADNPIEAAAQALIILRDPDSVATVFEVTDKTTGETTTVDLARDQTSYAGGNGLN
jgi:hypothetical protein